MMNDKFNLYVRPQCLASFVLIAVFTP